MSENYNNIALINKDDQFQFEVDRYVAFIDYGLSGDKLVLLHTEVPEEIEGRGVAAALVKKTLEYADAHQLKVVPRCAYVIAFLKKHPEWNGIVTH